MDDTRQVSTVLIDSIKADPNQPRKTFTEKHIGELSLNLQTIGLINPIEVDENLMIITGECRWRAAKQAGWTELPIIINTQPLTSYERLRRQISENILQSGGDKSEMMNPVDTAKGLARLLILKAYKKTKDPEAASASFPSDLMDKLNFKEEIKLYQAISSYSNKDLVDVYRSIPHETIYGLTKEVVEETGVRDHTIRELLTLLDQPEFVLVDVQAGRSRTYYQAVKGAPKEMQEQLKQKIARGDYKTRGELREDIRLAKNNPDLAQIELERKQAKESTETNKILNSVVRLGLALDSIELNKIDERERQIVIRQLQWIHDEIEKYLAEPKVLEGQVE